ncbi:MAG TPA: hypothetical protein ENJ53_03520, partial [Phaeodactylibacter sp.]|nr:hypothetical protein [Phaeodactylibacter sp.]
MFTTNNLKNTFIEVCSPFNFSPEMEKAYQVSAYPISIFMMRLAVVLGGLTYLSFYSLDALVFPETYPKLWIIRTIVIILLLLTLWFTYHPLFAKIHQPMVFALLTSFVVGQLVSIIILDSDIGTKSFFTGFFVIAACTYMLSQLNLKNCLLLFGEMIFGYVWVTGFYLGAFDEGYFSEKGISLFNDIFFLFSMNVIGVAAYITLQYFRRKGFLAQLLAEEERRKVELERLRIKISSDLHDDVGSILSGLAMQAEILQHTDCENQGERLIRLSELSRNAMSRMRDAVWAMDARKDKWENLQDRMREFAAEMLGEKGLAYQIDFQDINLKDQLLPEIRQNLYLIFKEAVTNVVKHSNATKVITTLKNTDSGFEMMIKDNGVLDDKEFQHSGLGLNNIKMRAKQIQASLEF